MHHSSHEPCRVLCGGSQILSKAVAHALADAAHTHIATDVTQLGKILAEPLCAVVVDGKTPFGQQLLSMAVYASASPLLIVLDDRSDLLKAVSEATLVDLSGNGGLSGVRALILEHRGEEV